ncbi:Transglycosylase SLT domain-containing protein [Arsukibacterium tuosuense]|uniref:Transglycosylase SLT domain-containing protein n=1 Tax=Arsukibacterium tuosuense TaxID=1323745 RepID=A0A285IEB0_9GAMM|nr:lytic transglycosylase domain-containing protein [Arsukibacterium tuosuense]SNY46305.1 Transglycosylase SLT domain-containing protein [Arsukibacterium tuosuense]
MSGLAAKTCWVGVLLCPLLLSAMQQSTDAGSEPKRQLKLSPDSARPLQQPKISPTAKATAANSIAVFKSNQADGTVLFSDRRPLNRPYQQLHFDCFACDPNSSINWYKTPLFVRPYNRIIDRVALEQKLDPALIRAIIHAESAFQPSALSKRGAIGLMQLMPDTAAMLGISDPLSPEQNIQGGSTYLAKLLKQYNGDLTLSLAAYNAGPGNVRRHQGVPPFAETQAYIKRVLILKKRYQQGA